MERVSVTGHRGERLDIFHRSRAAPPSDIALAWHALYGSGPTVLDRRIGHNPGHLSRLQRWPQAGYDTASVGGARRPVAI